MVTQYYVVEIKKNANGEYEHEVYWIWDADAEKALLKAYNKYHAVLSDAAISNTLSHAAILFSTEGFPIAHECYHHEIETASGEE
jgi:hypothetical protein